MKAINRLILGDARQMLDYFPVGEPVIDVTITSPPYWDTKNYGNINDQIGYGQSKQDYLDDLKSILKDCYQITKSTGSMWLILDTYRRNKVLELLPLELSKIAQEIGWKLRELIVWDKQYCLPWHQKGHMRNTSEYILFFTKSDEYKFYMDRIKNLDEISKWWVDFPERFNPKGKTPTNIWRFPLRRRGTWPNKSTINHLCPFPTGLVARIIEIASDEGDIIFDPFAGSGVVLVMAEQLRRRFLGFEINPGYVDMYENQVKESVAEEWKKKLSWRNTLEKSKADFEKSVMNLRVIKYSWYAIRAIQEVLDEEEISKVKVAICIAEIPDIYVRGENIKIQIWFVSEKNHRFLNKKIPMVKDRLSRPPLANYGISSDVFAGSIDNFYKNTGTAMSEIFYLYTNKKAKKFSAEDEIQLFLGNKLMESKKKSDNGIGLLANVAEDVSWVLD